jgi:hypothetical protein
MRVSEERWALRVGFKSVLRNLVRKGGYDVHHYPTSCGVLHQEHLFTQLSRLKVNCVIDVGAHFGEFGNYLRVLGYRGRIVSFEPVSKSFSVLAQRLIVIGILTIALSGRIPADCGSESRKAPT